MSRASGTAGADWDWVLLLPPGWARLPTAAPQARRAVTGLLDRRLRHLPRDEIAQVRRALERELRTSLSEARAAGASDVYMQVDLISGMPVSAALTVARIEVAADEQTLLEGLTRVLGASGDVVESGSGTAGGLPALRRRRHFQRPLAAGLEPTAQTAVDWLVSLPGANDVLVLSFVTSTAPVADELVVLFDAVARSLEVVRADGR